MKQFHLVLLTALIGIGMSPEASACAACFGKSDSPLAYGMNAGILSLLAVIGTMLGLIASFFLFVSRRAARIRETDSDGSAV